jgi:hypothetical protein
MFDVTPECQPACKVVDRALGSRDRDEADIRISRLYVSVSREGPARGRWRRLQSRLFLLALVVDGR